MFKAPTVIRRFWLIADDVSDDKLRRKVARLLAGRGYRIQYSAFLADMTETERHDLIADLEILDEEANASVRMYPLCEKCAEATFGGEESLVRALRGPWGL